MEIKAPYTDQELFTACKILFGEKMIPSRGFLRYLNEQGIKSAFRKQASILHPDKALVNGRSQAQSQQEFITLQEATSTLRAYISHSTRPTRKNGQRRPAATVNTKTSMHQLPRKELLFGRFLYHMGLIEWGLVLQAISWQRSSRLRIGELGVKLGYLEKSSILVILNHCHRSGAFGLTAQKLGLLSTLEVQELLLRQKRQQKLIGQFFVENQIFSEQQLRSLLSQCKNHNYRMKMLR